MSKYGLGYRHLNEFEKRVYDAFEKALHNNEIDVEIPMCEDACKILNTVLGDNPDIIHVPISKLVYTKGLFSKKVSLVTCFSKKQRILMEEELKRRVEEIVWEVDKNARNDRDILMGISEYFQRNIKYDYSQVNSTIKSNSNAHSAYGALVQNLAVCEGVSKAYSLVLSYFGISSMVVSGKAVESVLPGANHSWNIVAYENQFYHCDITWDLCCCAEGMYFYRYFGLDDDEMALDHQWDLSKTPNCSGDKLSYYKHNHLMAYSIDQISDIIRRQYKNGNSIIRLKVDDKVTFYQDENIIINEKIRLALEGHGLKYYWDNKTRSLTILV